jgi:hypothetical protein
MRPSPSLGKRVNFMSAKLPTIPSVLVVLTEFFVIYMPFDLTAPGLARQLGGHMETVTSMGPGATFSIAFPLPEGSELGEKR